MNESDRWQRVKHILGEVIELAPAQRAEKVQALCGDDAALRAEVMALLQGLESSRETGEDPFIRAIEDAGPLRRVAGEQIGDWTLEREIGRGGMGTVWRARRQKAGFAQLAALKLVDHVHRQDLLARFRLERRALAELQHRNIAHLLDGGEAADGTPYLAMEFIEGLGIDRWCEERALPLRERVALILQLIDALAHAHGRLLVHRDIKPSNVLVNVDGVVKLVDFGIVKPLAAGDSLVATLAQTEAGSALTPLYASPEQIKGASITVGTDIYGIGALLYLLAGGAPVFDKWRSQPLDLLRAIADAQPDSLIGKKPAGSVQAVDADLDIIIQKCLEKSPQDRYLSGRDLERDLRAWLDGYPITARRPGAVYVARKFVLRNRGLSAAVAVTALAVAGGLAGVLWQANEARQQRDLALAAEQQAKQALAETLLERERATLASQQAEQERQRAVDSSTQADKARQNEALQRLVAEKRFAEVRTLANHIVNEYADELMGTFGTTETRLRIINDSVAFLDTLRRTAASDEGVQDELARGYRKLALALSGDASLRDYKRAQAQLQVARDLRSGLIRKRPATARDELELALLDAVAGDLEYQQFHHPEAIKHFERASEHFRHVGEIRSDDAWDLVAPMRVSLQHAQALVVPGPTPAQAEQAQALLTQAAAEGQRLLATPVATRHDLPGVVRFHLSQAHFVRSILYRQQGDPKRALVELDLAEGFAADLSNRHPNNAIYLQNWAQVLGDRKTVRLLLGDDGGGFSDAIKRMELASIARDREPGNPQAVIALVSALTGICSDSLRLERNVPEAGRICQRTVEGARALLALRDVDPFTTVAWQAMVVGGLGQVKHAGAGAAGAQQIEDGLRIQMEGLQHLTRATPAVKDDPMRTVFLVNSEISVAQGLELAARHDEATRMHEDSLRKVAAIRATGVAESNTQGLAMFIHRRMAHNFLAKAARTADVTLRASLQEASRAAATAYLAEAEAAKARNRLSPLFASFVAEMQRLSRAD